jgi:hypothetical protein
MLAMLQVQQMVATVIWDNQDTALHTASSGNPDTAVPDGKFDTGIVGPHQPSGPVTMPTQPGDYIYFCTLHPFLDLVRQRWKKRPRWFLIRTNSH